MNEKSSFLHFFNEANMGKAYEDAAEVRWDTVCAFLVLSQLMEQMKAGLISREFARRDYDLMTLYFKTRCCCTEEKLLDRSVIGCTIRLTDELGLDDGEKLILALSLVACDERLDEKYWVRLTESRIPGKQRLASPSMEAACRLGSFTLSLVDKAWQSPGKDVLSLLFSDADALTPRESLRTFSQGGEAKNKPAGVVGLFCERIQTGESDELSELILHGDILSQLEHMAADNSASWTIRLGGDKGAGKQLTASHLAKSMGRDLLVVDGDALRDYKKETAVYFAESSAKSWFFELVLCAVLGKDLVYLKNVDNADIRLMREYVSGLIIVAEDTDRYDGGNDREFDPLQSALCDTVTFKFKAPMANEKAALWNAFLDRFAHDDSIDPYMLAGKYVLNAGEILDVLFAARAHSAGCMREEIGADDITWAVGQSQSGGLGSFAKLVDCVFDWDDLIVEDSVRKQMEYICAQMKYRHLVGSDWGFFDKMPYGRGLSVLFYGAPGTGKTMAAQVIAKELGLDLYRIDLSEMVSKYIGETEKNISKLFEKARHMNVILFFDEADAFFSKRSEVKDSHDRNANAEVAHLLQEMECYDGITILATNMKDNMDDAFKRRIKLMLKFSFPPAETRRKLWHSLLPDKTPRQDNLALDFFADKFELSGSQIKDTLLMAAFIAANDGCILGNEQIKEALCLNYRKYGKLLTERDFEYV